MNRVFCPECNGKKIIKKGKRTGSYKTVQVYQCKSCKKVFTDSRLKHTTYSARMIVTALNYYHLGYTFDEVSRQLNKTFKIKTSKSTIHSWVKKYQKFCPISSWRQKSLYDTQTVFTKRFDHENLQYDFLYHRYKLQRYAAKRFPKLARYLCAFEQGCPDEFFEIGERCSQPIFTVTVEVQNKVNLACHMAAFTLLAKRNNRERHHLIESFMLINDTATVACEVPVWYWEKSINSGITGHIDILQVRQGTVVIMDYKPNACKEKKAAQQLYHYALALSFRTGIPFDRIRCAWFDEHTYHEYAPSEAKATLINTRQPRKRPRKQQEKKLVAMPRI